jgi:hypothetical protein
MPARSRGTGRTTPKGTKDPAKNGRTKRSAPTPPEQRRGRPPANERSTGRVVNQRPVTPHRGNR